MLDCLDYSKLLYKCRKGVLRNNIDLPRLGVAEPLSDIVIISVYKSYRSSLLY